jgi:[acyl-carrier-protein] S-malonyltransferase
MESAVSVLGGYARAISVHDPRSRLISNTDGTVVHDGRNVLRRLVTQVANPVRWDLCMATMEDLGVTAVIEIPPAGVLTGLIKRALPGVETLAVNTPDDLPAAWDIIARHGRANQMESTPTWRMLVSPSKGAFTPEPHLIAGAELAPGSVAGTVTSRRETTKILAPHGGVVVEVLAQAGDPVAPGQPLVRLHPVPGSEDM